jgi:hypothetical protein
MASTYTNDLRLELIATGEAAATWGDKTNTNLTNIAAAFGYATQDGFAANADATTTVADGSADPARAMYFKVTSSATLTATRTLTIAPNTISRVMWIENATTGGQSIAISQGTGANVTIATGKTAVVYLDGAGSGAAVVDAMAGVSSGASDTLAEILAAGNTTGGTDIAVGTGDDITLADSSKAIFGAGSDLQIYHDGTHSYVDDSSGAGRLILKTDYLEVQNAAGNEAILGGIQDGAVSLFYDGNTKLASSSSGVTISGVATMGGLAVDGGAISTGDFTGTAAGSVRISGNGTTLGTTSFDLIQNSSGAYVYHRANLPLIFGTNNAERFRIGSTGIIYVNGDGTGGRLSGDGSGGLVLQDGNGRQTFKIMSPSSGSVQAMTLDASSNLLVGTTSTTVGSGGAGTTGFRVDGANGIVQAASDGTTAGIFNRTTDDGTILDLRKDGSTIGSLGNDGTDLTINSQGGMLKLFLAGSRNYNFDTSRFYPQADNARDLGASSVRFKDLYLSGNIITSGNSFTATTSGYFFGGAGSYANGIYGVGVNNVAINANGSERARLTNDGIFLVGKTSSDLTTDGFEVRPTGFVGVRSNGDPLYLNRKSSDGAIASFAKDGTTVGSIGTNGGDLFFADASYGGIKPLGDAYAIVPSTNAGADYDNAMSLGTSSVRFKDAYLSGGVYLGGTAAANKLDDYEEGTWTPTLTTGTASAGPSKYTRVGRLVTCYTYLSSFSDTTATADVTIGGLPFTAEANDKATTMGCLAQYIDASFGPVTSGYLNTTSSLMLYTTSSGGFDKLKHGDLTSSTAIYISFSYMAS